MIFKDSYTLFYLDKEEFEKLPILERLSIISTALTALDLLRGKGYLNSLNLTTYPVIQELLVYFTHSTECNDYLNGDRSMDVYKWLYNLLILNLYYLTISTINTVECKKNFEDLEDVLADLKMFERLLFSKIDSSIRYHMRKVGISIVKNTYCGFDTEFINTDVEKNSLVSSQLAITSKISVKIPKIKKYKLSIIDVERNKLKKVKLSSDVFNFNKVEMSIDWVIKEIKLLKYGNYDESMLVLGEVMKIIQGLRYYESDEYLVFSLPRSAIQPYINFSNSMSLKYLLNVTTQLSNPILISMEGLVMNLIDDICNRHFSTQNGLDKLAEEIYHIYHHYGEVKELEQESVRELKPVEELKMNRKVWEKDKKLSRKFLNIFPGCEKVCFTTTRNYYYIAHLTQADFSLLKDFELIKDELSIVNGSLITVRDPIKYCDKNIHVRDTMLLAPGGSKSLAKIGALYGAGLQKIEISKTKLADMQTFLTQDKAKFVEYALRDALISLIHSLWMDDFNFNLCGVGMPITLSSIGRKFVKSIWNEQNYQGYQISNKYLLGDVSSTMTPKGLNIVKNIGFVLPFYIANYKGGRNECFMYGVDKTTMWYDYDLTSAYTTIMSMAGDPSYIQYRRLTEVELNKLSMNEILYSYLVIQADFSFPPDTKYPSIPCFVDESCTIYPLNGSCVLTGSEYLLAKSQGCVLQINEIHYIPFTRSSDDGGGENLFHKPFEHIIKLVQEKRREYEKGTISNLMYKEIGNSIYGSVVRGIGDKKKFDIKSKTTQRMRGDDLSNPLIASWTTAYVRSVVGECLHSIQQLGGLVVSVTTDGFITNLSDFEQRMEGNYLLKEYKEIRHKLSNDFTGLELKNFGKGILAWTTRGQLGFESKIIATTGFQHIYKKDDMWTTFSEIFASEHKSIEFVQSRLRSASDIYKRGGHVTMVYKDQQFRMHYDQKRLLEYKETVDGLLDSKPLKNIIQGENLRYIGKLYKSKQYNKFSNLGGSGNKYNNHLELAVRNFVKGLLSEPPMFNLHRVGLESNQKIVDFIHRFNPEIKITVNSISLLKNRSIKWKCVPRLTETEEFAEYVLLNIDTFSKDFFFRSF